MASANVSRNSAGLGSSPVREASGHIRALDGVRGQAIAMVLAYHLLWSNADTGSAVLDFLTRLRGSLWCGVDLFFALSGFLITGILFDSLADPHYFKNFYLRRFLRIFPLYYGVVLVFLGILFILGYGNGFNLRALGLVAIFVQNAPVFFERSVGSIPEQFLGHFWSLAIEEQFYLVWPVLVFLVRDRRRLMNLALVLAVAAPVIRILMLAHGASLSDVYHLTICRQDSLLAGAWLSLAVRGPARDAVLRRCRIVLPLALVAVCVVAWYGDGLEWQKSAILGQVGFSFVALAAASWIGLAITPSSKVAGAMNFQPLRFLGRYSFGLYVYDEILEQIWSIVIHRHSELWNRIPTHALGHLAYCFLNLATLLPLAMISFHLYERPFLKLKSFFNYQRTMPSPTADASVR